MKAWTRLNRDTKGNADTSTEDECSGSHLAFKAGVHQLSTRSFQLSEGMGRTYVLAIYDIDCSCRSIAVFGGDTSLLVREKQTLWR